MKVLDSIFGHNTSVMNHGGRDAGRTRRAEARATSEWPDLDPIAEKAYDYYNSNSYAGVTYGKTASVLLTLEGIIGEDTMAKAMHVYFMKYRFTHPTKEDFLKTIEEVSGKDLRWYFNQAIYGTQVMDYEVLEDRLVPGELVRGEKGADEKKEDKRHRLPFLCVAAAQRRFRVAGRGGD